MILAEGQGLVHVASETEGTGEKEKPRDRLTVPGPRLEI